ncbi:MAG: HAD hydrolase-like protein, partial [Pseudomonadota bacterium]
QAGLDALGGVRPGRCLMIGDSPEHDIAGAKAAGCQTLLISSGVQAGTDRAGAEADYRMERLRW